MNILMRLHDPALPYVHLDLRREATHVLTGIMEAMWIAPWFAVVLPQVAALSPYTLLLYVTANLLAALLIVRVLDSRGIYINLRHVVFLSGLLLAVLLSTGTLFPPQPSPALIEISDNIEPVEMIEFPAILPVLLLVSLVWWRGLRLAVMTPTPLRVSFGLRLGILGYLVVAFFPNTQAYVLTSLPPFFFFGLLAISLARANALRESGGPTVPFGPRWIFFMALAALAITFVGFVIAASLSGLDPDAILNVIQPVLSVLLMGLTVLMTPVFLVVQAIMTVILNAFNGPVGNIIISPEPIQIPQGDPQQTNPLEQVIDQIRQFFDMFGGLGVCLTVVIILVIVGIIVLTLTRSRRAELSEDEEREDLDSDALGSLRGLLRRGLDAFNAARHAVGQFGLGRDLFAALTIRRAYAQMVRLATRQGIPRAVAQTPYEYRVALFEAFPTVRDEVDTITEAYVRSHYGELPETEDALRAVTDALQRLKTMPNTPATPTPTPPPTS